MDPPPQTIRETHETFTFKYKTHPTNEELEIDVCVPNSVRSGTNTKPLPIVYRIHGGYLHFGDGSTHTAPVWLHEMVNSANAIYIAPTFHLLPESSGIDIVNDILTAWDTTRSTLGTWLAQEYQQPPVPDWKKIFLFGESAGGFGVFLLSVMRAAQIKAALALYPMGDLDMPPMRGLPKLPIVEYKGEFYGPGVLDEYRRKTTWGTGRCNRKEAVSEERGKMVNSSVHAGAFWGFYTRDGKVSGPMEVLDPGASARTDKQGEVVREIAPLWIIHGAEDTLIPIASSRNWYDKAKRSTLSKSTLEHVSVPGMRHGFDGELRANDLSLEKTLEAIKTQWGV